MPLTDRFTVVTVPFAQKLNTILARGDFNGDGWTDFLLGQSRSGAKQPVALALSDGRGGYAITTDGLPTGFKLELGYGYAADFTGDGILDIAVFDAGYYDLSARTGKGHPPTLLVGDGKGRFTASSALADAVLNAPKNSYLGSFNDADLAIKSFTAGDIDNDGDLDLWVESTGADNITNHFQINLGNGKFQVDPARIAKDTLFGNAAAGDYWRYGRAELLDLNRDGYLDLVLLQIRDNDPTHIRQHSFVVYNDKTGHFPLSNRVALPDPDFYSAYTSVEAAAKADINGDGVADLVLAHTRNDDVSGPNVEPGFTGRYLQVLIGNGDGTFRDESLARLGDQAITKNVKNVNNAPHDIQIYDVDGDGDLDLVLGLSNPVPSATAPVLMLNNGDGKFTAADAAYFTDGNVFFGEGGLVADFNRDGRLDMVHLDALPGRNGVYENTLVSDDTVQMIVQLGKAKPTDAATSAGGVKVVQMAQEVLRVSDMLLRDYSSLKTAAASYDSGTVNAAGLTAAVTALAGASTSVATMSYQFFTGKIPSQLGFDYLVSPTGPNANNLNSAYYQSFNLENRYINFAVNLGREGEGRTKFQAEYGSLSLAEATKKAYGVIFGSTPTDSKVAVLLSGGRDQYFAAYGKDGLDGLGTKGAMVGWLLAEAVKADIGVYAKANDAFLIDLSDGATLAVDLVGVYGKPEHVYIST